MSTSRPSLVPGAEETRLVQTLFFNEASSRVHTDILVWGQDCSWLCDWSLSHYHREEPPKPTTGLEYTYGRRSRGANIVRVNCKLLHSWGCSGMHSNCSLILNKNVGGTSRTGLFVFTHHFKWNHLFKAYTKPPTVWDMLPPIPAPV